MHLFHQLVVVTRDGEGDYGRTGAESIPHFLRVGRRAYRFDFTPW